MTGSTQPHRLGAYGGLVEEETPVTVITGFLGSGKTTFINALLARGLIRDAAFIVNEFGDVPIDHMLVDTPGQRIAVMHSGCICCAVASDLEQTLQNLFMKRARGIVPPFRSVVIETSGLATPGPVLETLVSRPVTDKGFRLAGVVTLVDAVEGGMTLEAEIEAAAQLAVADLIAFTKSDRATPVGLECLRDLVRERNAAAPLASAVELLADPGPLSEMGLLPNASGEVHAIRRRHPFRLRSCVAAPTARHDDTVGSLAFILDEPPDWSELNRRLREIARGYGGHILRVKGVVRLKGFGDWFAIHGVRSSFEPPEPVSNAMVGHGAGALVLIGRNLEAKQMARALEPLARPAIRDLSVDQHAWEN